MTSIVCFEGVRVLSEEYISTRLQTENELAGGEGGYIKCMHILIKRMHIRGVHWIHPLSLTDFTISMDITNKDSKLAKFKF